MKKFILLFISKTIHWVISMFFMLAILSSYIVPFILMFKYNEPLFLLLYIISFPLGITFNHIFSDMIQEDYDFTF